MRAPVRPLMVRITCAVMVASALTLTACQKKGEGTYEVQKPVIGTVTETVHTPSISVHTDSTKVAVPDIDVKKDSATIKFPKVEVKKNN